MFLFDTDIITNIFKKNSSQRLLVKLKNLNHKDQFVSTITIGEIVYGAMKSKRPTYHLDNLTKIFMPAVNILTFDCKATFVYGQIRASLENIGKPISHTDMQIASIAIANNLTLITGNVKHFERIENLKKENWL